jgi:hypothetical protein
VYQSHWGIEVFFKQIKQIKQTLQRSSFLGHSENAIRWQVWMALLTYVLLRFVGHMGQWTGSLRRRFTLLRGVLMSRRNLWRLLASCGTAPGRSPPKPSLKQPCLPGLMGFMPPAH